MVTGPFWTISNVLSSMRVLLTVPIAVFLLRRDPGDRAVLIALVLVASLTDLLDGWLARKLGKVTEIGKILDPLADKIAVGTVVVILVLQARVPVWFVVMVLARDALILVGGLYARQAVGVVLESNLVGKWTVAVIAAFLSVTMIEGTGSDWLALSLLLLSAVMMLISLALYVRRFIRLVFD